VRVVFRDMPLAMHKDAQGAAEAANCASDQDKFWEYHDKLFENQRALDVNSLKQYAIDLQLDTAQFDTCLDSGKHTEDVKKDALEAQSLGVSGTPAFFVNGRFLNGAQPFEAFERIINEELALKGLN
jgi:protein-disulfide isomerase